MDVRLTHMIQFSSVCGRKEQELGDTSLLWRTVIAVPEQLCPEELGILDHWICPETLWYWSQANPWCINISLTMGPIKMHLMYIVKKMHFIWRKLLSCILMSCVLFWLFRCWGILTDFSFSFPVSVQLPHWYRHDRLSDALKPANPTILQRGSIDKSKDLKQVQ